MESILKIIIALIIMSIVLYLFYFVTKYFGKKMVTKKGELMRIVDVLPLSQDSYILLVEISHKLILLGKTQKNISYLAQFEKEELIKSEKQFEEILSEKKYASTNLKDKIGKLYSIFKDDNDGE